MNKIGIITLHRNTNYGANLQTFASCLFINKNGFNCNVIDYSTPEHDYENHILKIIKRVFKSSVDKSPQHIIKLILAMTIFSGPRAIKIHKFKSFRKKFMPQSKSCSSILDIQKLNYETIVCGSDQLWNADITGGINPAYYGVIPGVKKTISYAASMGGYKFPNNNIAVAKELISSINFCSLREDKTAEYISKQFGKKTVCVCDPVFLLEKKDYQPLMSKPLSRKKYALLYAVISDEKLTEIAQTYANIHGIKLIEIGGEGLLSRSKHRQLPATGPEEFIRAIADSEVVFTNSFHGTAFSIIFEKQFYVHNNPFGGERITSLLSTAGISERIVSDNSDIAAIQYDIDYNKVNSNMRDYIERSKYFLINSLQAKMEDITDSCCGCGACSTVCPKQIITIHRDKEGFNRAFYNEYECIHCHKCISVCPTHRNIETKKEEISVYAFKAEDDIRLKSTSGGAFFAFANAILDQGGIVYGAAFDKHFSVSHIRAENKKELHRILGVKYIQSNSAKCFEQIEKDLINERKTLFSGTPCQVYAVKAFAKSKHIPTENLYTIDIICHGVASPVIFHSYLEWIEKKLGSAVMRYNFRDKNISWRGNSSSIVLKDGKYIHSTKDIDSFINTYYSGCITCMACNKCKFATINRDSDITISDYWGIENAAPDFEDSLGVSMIVVNSKKGSMMLPLAKGVFLQTDISTAKQPHLYIPSKPSDDRNLFWKMYDKNGIYSVLHKYGGLNKKPLYLSALSKFYHNQIIRN